MYKVKRSFVAFQNHEVHTRFKSPEFEESHQAIYWYNVWRFIARIEVLMHDKGYEHLDVRHKLWDKWTKLWPHELRDTDEHGAPLMPKLPTMLDVFNFLGNKYARGGLSTDYYRKGNDPDWFNMQSAYGIICNLYKQHLDVKHSDIDDFCYPLFKHNRKKFLKVMIDVVEGVENISDFVLNTKEQWKNTVEMNDWKLKQADKDIEDWKNEIITDEILPGQPKLIEEDYGWKERERHYQHGIVKGS